MAYKQKNLPSLVRGDDWVIKLTLTSEGSAIDITGHKFWLTLKSSIDDADPGALQVSVTGAGADALNGVVYVVAPRADTQNVAPTTYYYDIQHLDISSDTMQTILIGRANVVKDVTRSVS